VVGGVREGIVSIAYSWISRCVRAVIKGLITRV
jgi:hypothetical protein